MSVKEVANRLTALRFMLHEIHLRFTEYDVHLLTDRLIEPIDGFTDRVKEIYIGQTGNLDIAWATDTLKDALSIVAGFTINYETSNSALSTVGPYYKDLMELIEKMCAADQGHKQGMLNVLADISEYCLQSMYLLRGTVNSLAVKTSQYEEKKVPQDFSNIPAEQIRANFSALAAKRKGVVSLGKRGEIL